MNPETLTWISGIVLLFLFAIVALRMCRTGPRHGPGGYRHGSHGTGGCCGPSQPTGRQKHEQGSPE